MTIIDDIAEQRMFARARDGLSPSELDEARVLAKLEQHFAEHALSQHEQPSPEQSGSPAVDHGGASLGKLARVLRVLVTRPIASVACTVVLGVLGVMAPTLVARVWRNDTQSEQRKPAVVPLAGAPAKLADAAGSGEVAGGAVLVAEQEPAEAVHSAAEDSQPPAATKHKRRRAPPRCPEGDGCPALPAARIIAPSPEPAPPPAAVTSLRVELEVLKEAERAVRERQPARALELLASFERESRDGAGRMQQERAATKAIARCALGESRHTVYAEFVRAYPRSAYAERVRHSCIPGL